MNETFTSCCFTGYRPSKFPFKLDGKSKEYIKFENDLTQKIFELIETGCHTFYSGMAMGFDIIAAESVLLARQGYKKAPIKLVCTIPFIKHSDTFSYEWRKRYKDILALADQVLLTSDDYYKGCYAYRNKIMVDYSDYVLTWYDGKPGGTKNTIEYAKKLGRHIINLNENIADNPNMSFTEFFLE